MTTHIDFLNITAGQPDDSWTDADFIDLELLINQYFVNLAPLMHTSTKVTEIRWYRVGPGITPPNPAVRIFPLSISGAATGALPPQVAASVTLKTVPRKQWGRMYLPLLGLPALSPTGRFAANQVDQVGTRTDELFAGAVAKEKIPVIFSKVRGKAYSIEVVQVDDVPDVIRSRRFNEATHKYITP